MKTSFAIAFAAALISISSAASAESASANAASSPCAGGKCSYIDFTSGKDFTRQSLYGPNSQITGAVASGISEVVISGSTFSSSAPGHFIFNGSQKITIENTTFSNATDGSLFFQTHKGSSDVEAGQFVSSIVTLNNVNLTNNSASSGSGGAMYVYGKLDMTMKDGAVSGNTITYSKAGQAYGGGIVVKSGNVVFENVDFDNNVVKAKSGYATGGAILVDKTTGIKENGKDLIGDVTFKITKNGLTYAGNNVVGKADSYVDTYGWYASTSDGFLFLDRSNRGTFDIADGVTLTIGEAGADYENNPELDSIASALPNASNYPDYATLTKKGAGTVQMNASMDKYFSFFNVEEGTFSIAQEWHNRAKTTVTGGTLNAAGGLVLDNLKQEKNSYYQNGTITVDGGALVAPSIAFKNTENATDEANKATLTIKSGTVTTKDLNTTNGVLTLSGGALNVTGNLTVAAETFDLAGGELATSYKNFFTASQAGGTLAGNANLTNIKGTKASGIIAFTDDIGTYTLKDLKKTQAQFNAAERSTAVQIVFRNGTLKLEGGDDLTSSSLDNLIVENVVGDAKTDGEFTVTNNTTIAAVDFGSATNATAGSSNGMRMLTLTANAAGGNVFVYDADSKLDTVEVKNVQLGNNESASGNVNIKTLNVKEKLDVVGAFTAQDVALDSSATATVSGAFDLKSLTGKGSLSVEEGGVLSATNIGANVQLDDGGMLVLNAAGVDDDGVTAVVSTQPQAAAANGIMMLSVVPEEISANIVTTNRNAKAIIASLNHIEDVEGFEDRNILFVDRAVKLGSTGQINIGTKTGAAGTLTIGENALAILDADNLSGGAPVVEGKLSVAEGSEVYVIANGKKSLLLTEDETPLAAVPNVTVSNKLLGMTTEVQKDLGLVATIGVKENATQDAELLSAINTAFNDAKNGRVLGAIAEVEGFYTDDFTEAGRHAAEEYLAMPVTAGTYNVAYDAAEQVTGAILRRNLEPSTGLGVWADVFYTTNEAKKLYGGQGYSADIYGGTLGFDGTFSCGAKLGLALSVGSGDADAEKSIGKYSNDADFWGVSVYTGKDIAGLYLSADASYLSLDNDVKGTIAGASADESLDSSVFTVGVRGDLTVYDQAFKVVPHVGLRYTKIDVDDYRGISADSMNVFETPVGVRIAGEFAPAAGWTVTPDIDFTIVPQVGDKEVSTLVGDVDVLDNVYNTTLAVRAACGNFSFGLSYRYGFGADDRSNNAFEARAAYVW